MPDAAYYKPDEISVGSENSDPFHSGTHTSQLLSQGVPIPTVSKRLGHANPSITLRLYSHALESDELAAAKRWNDAFAELVEAHIGELATHKRAKEAYLMLTGPAQNATERPHHEASVAARTAGV